VVDFLGEQPNTSAFHWRGHVECGRAMADEEWLRVVIEFNYYS
jgi:hypothetical protein